MCFSVLNRRRKASTLWKNGRSRRSAFIAGNMRWWKGEDRVFEKLRKRQQELEEKPYPDELYGFESEIYEFFMLVAGSLGYVLANKRMPRHQQYSLEKSFFELYPDIPLDMIKHDTDLYHHILLYEQVRQEICAALSN